MEAWYSNNNISGYYTGSIGRGGLRDREEIRIKWKSMALVLPTN